MAAPTAIAMAATKQPKICRWRMSLETALLIDIDLTKFYIFGGFNFRVTTFEREQRSGYFCILVCFRHANRNGARITRRLKDKACSISVGLIKQITVAREHIRMIWTFIPKN